MLLSTAAALLFRGGEVHDVQPGLFRRRRGNLLRVRLLVLLHHLDIQIVHDCVRFGLGLRL